MQLNQRNTRLVYFGLGLTTILGVGCGGGNGNTALTAPATTIEAAMTACPNSIEELPEGATKVSFEELSNGARETYYIKHIKQYVAGQQHVQARPGTTRPNDPRSPDTAEQDQAGAAMVTLTRTSAPKLDLQKADFEFKGHCRYTAGGLIFTGNNKSALVYDRGSSNFLGEIAFSYGGSADKDLAIDSMTISTTVSKPLENFGEGLGATNGIFRLPSGDLVMRVSQDKPGSTPGSRIVIAAEMLLERGPELTQTLDDFIEYFQTVRDESTGSYVFRGTSAVDEAREAFALKRDLQSIRQNASYFAKITGEPSGRYLFKRKGPVRLAMRLLGEGGVNFSKLQKRIKYYQELLDPNTGRHLYPDVEAVQATFDELSIPVEAPLFQDLE